MKSLDAFYPAIMPFAPGVPRPTANNWIRQAAIEFCERTKLWRFEDDFTVEGGTEDIMAQPGSTAISIELAQLDGVTLDPVTTKWLDDHYSGWRTDTEVVGGGQYITQLEQDTFRIIPNSSGSLYLSLILKPTHDAKSLPDFMANKHRQVIADGALGRILAIPNQSFTDLQMAATCAALFNGALDRLSTSGTTGQQRAKVRSKARFM